jgi:hypothetical protein
VDLLAMNLKGWKTRAIQWWLERGLGAPPDVMLLLGDRPRVHAHYVRIETRALWAAEPLPRKIRALIRGRWQYDPAIAQAQAIDTYKTQVFGTEDDWGDHLIELYDWHLRRDWELNALTEKDSTRADALASFTVLTRLRYRDIASSPLNLRLGARMLPIAGLVYPMIAKMPVVSFMYFLDIDVHYAFNAIRSANHPHADEVIAFLYELLFLQQKVAIGLQEYLRLVAYAEEHKRSAQLINAEVNAVMTADGIFSYLKASVEKTIALVGVTHGIRGLDAKKDHKARLSALRSGLPANIDQIFYARFLFDVVGSENLEDLNNYRSGLLHKKGIADLQPHNYVGQNPQALPLRKIFSVMHSQHVNNTAALLVVLALLTDDLVRRDPPPFSPGDIPDQRYRAVVRAYVQENVRHGEDDSTVYASPTYPPDSVEPQ